VQEEIFAAPVLDAAPGHAGDPAVLDNKHVKNSYARWAPVYDLVFALVLRPGRKAAAAAADRLGGHVLDVGVGTGLELPMFDRRTRLTGIDLSEPMLRRAQWRVRAKALGNVEGLVVMDAARLAFPDAHFDAVVAPYVLTVVPEPHASLHELARVVKSGGEIILVNHVGSGHGPMAWVESALSNCGAELGWQPEFAWSILGDWIDSTPSVRLVERRKLPPFGLFTLARIARL
jgi:phosphatidylethanolamine/phosphatidyl-N-methylethanolamine N-methyltransferase